MGALGCTVKKSERILPDSLMWYHSFMDMSLVSFNKPHKDKHLPRYDVIMTSQSMAFTENTIYIYTVRWFNFRQKSKEEILLSVPVTMNAKGFFFFLFVCLFCFVLFCFVFHLDNFRDTIYAFWCEGESLIMRMGRLPMVRQEFVSLEPEPYILCPSCPTITKQSNWHLYWLFQDKCQLLCKASIDSK